MYELWTYFLARNQGWTSVSGEDSRADFDVLIYITNHDIYVGIELKTTPLPVSFHSYSPFRIPSPAMSALERLAPYATVLSLPLYKSGSVRQEHLNLTASGDYTAIIADRCHTWIVNWELEAMCYFQKPLSTQIHIFRSSDSPILMNQVVQNILNFRLSTLPPPNVAELLSSSWYSLKKSTQFVSSSNEARYPFSDGQFDCILLDYPAPQNAEPLIQGSPGRINRSRSLSSSQMLDEARIIPQEQLQMLREEAANFVETFYQRNFAECARLLKPGGYVVALVLKSWEEIVVRRALEAHLELDMLLDCSMGVHYVATFTKA
jgi:CheY-like chemotaxis protein